jgi:hypothetical protein
MNSSRVILIAAKSLGIDAVDLRTELINAIMVSGERAGGGSCKACGQILKYEDAYKETIESYDDLYESCPQYFGRYNKRQYAERYAENYRRHKYCYKCEELFSGLTMSGKNADSFFSSLKFAASIKKHNQEKQNHE